MFEASRFKRHSRTRVGIAAVAVAGRSGTIVAVPMLCEPAIECFSEFFENALTGLRMKIRIAFVAFKFGFEFPVIGDLARFVPLFLCIVATDVPEFPYGVSELIEIVTHLPRVGDQRLECSDGAYRDLYS